MPQLGNGRISKLFEDREGTLWIGLENGRLLAWRDGTVPRFISPAKSGVWPWIRPSSLLRRMALAPSGFRLPKAKLGRLTEEGVEFVAVTGAGLSRSSLGLAVDRHGALVGWHQRTA